MQKNLMKNDALTLFNIVNGVYIIKITVNKSVSNLAKLVLSNNAISH